MADSEMTFWDHLDELRGVLIRMSVVIILAFIIFFCLMPKIFEPVILAPCSGSFPIYRWFDMLASVAGESAGSSDDFSVSLINTQLASQFFIHISLSFQLALVATFPILICLLWQFVAPALYPHERRNAFRIFLCGSLLFYLGVASAYYLIFPLTLRFLADYQLSTAIPNTITLDSYMENFVSILLIMGVTFEIPLVTWALGKMGLISRGFFTRYRRHAIVVLVIAAAVITPTSDPFTLMAVFIPLYILWELSASLTPKEDSEGGRDSE